MFSHGWLSLIDSVLSIIILYPYDVWDAIKDDMSMIYEFVCRSGGGCRV
jgi:hypothetical protein